MQLPRDPQNISPEITYSVVPTAGGFNVERIADAGGNASLYKAKVSGPDRAFADMIAATCAAAEDGTVVEA